MQQDYAKQKNFYKIQEDKTLCVYNNTYGDDEYKSGCYRNEGTLKTKKDDTTLIFGYNKFEGTLTVIEEGNDGGFLIFGVREAMQAKGGKWNIGFGTLKDASFEILM